MAKQTENNVGIYLRLSKEDMLEGESLSIENQKMILTKFVHDKGWNLVSEYVDEGITGTSVKKREGFNRMIADSEEGRIDLILTKEVSRFARNTVDTLNYTRRLFALNIGVIFMNDGIDTREKDGELRLTIVICSNSNTQTYSFQS